MATMREVAQLARVSVATVSAVINNSTFVSDELKERVIQAIQELDYRPNALARSLKSSRTRLLGFMLSNITNPFYPEIVLGAEDVARKEGYNIFVCTTDDDEERAQTYLDSMLEHRVDGMLVGTVDELSDPTLRKLKAAQVPLVLVNRWPEGYKGNTVVLDNIAAGILATNHLLSLGYREIAFVGASRKIMTSRQREDGYRQAMKLAGIPVPEHFVRYCDYSEERAYEEFRRMAKTGRVPRAVFAGNDLMAFGIIRAFLDEGFKIPEDVAVVGCDDIAFSSKFFIPLTTVHFHKYEMGKLSAELLIKAINSPDSEDSQSDFIQLKPHLVVRKSCGAN